MHERSQMLSHGNTKRTLPFVCAVNDGVRHQRGLVVKCSVLFPTLLAGCRTPSSTRTDGPMSPGIATFPDSDVTSNAVHASKTVPQSTSRSTTDIRLAAASGLVIEELETTELLPAPVDILSAEVPEALLGRVSLGQSCTARSTATNCERTAASI